MRPVTAAGPRLVLSAMAFLSAPATVSAQPWITREQPVLWVSGSLDVPVSARTALWLDGSWRRMNMGLEPMQFVVRPGVQFQLTTAARAAVGYAYFETEPAGKLASSLSQREHRTWQQLVITQRLGGVSLSHRYRMEQRWQQPIIGRSDRDSGVQPATAYQNRARYMVRAQHVLPRAHIEARPLTAHVWLEALATVGGSSHTATVAQHRAGAGVTLPMAPALRLELSYLRLQNVMSARRANEVNHTMLVAWAWTRARRP